jgi:hypothetical protein
MTVPRGASRSNRRAHPSRLGWARGFLPSWPCEFDSRHPLQSIAPSQCAFTAPELFEHADDKNNQAGHLFFMIIGARPTYAPCQAGFHELRIGWSQSCSRLLSAQFGPNSHELRFRKSASPALQPRMWISSREMSEQRRAWLAFSSLARPVHYWADALVFVETKRGGHERAEPTTVREHDRGRDREGSEENAGYKAKNAGYPVWNTPLATPKTFLASSSCFIARTMSALGADNRSCNNLLRNLPIP